MPEGLLKTKLFPPPPRTNHVIRKSLLDKFVQARQNGGACMLVSAPAGFGKTTLTVDCVRAGEISFAWLALDERDNDLLRFWRYVDAALATIDSHIGEGLRPALYAAQAPSIHQIVTGLINDIINIEKELILVLDDYHVIELPAIHESLNYLLDYLPPQMCLVVITRSDPPLNLARRRGRGQLIEIRANELRFTPDETAAFLNETMQLELNETDIASLGQRTEGWIAGLQMAALSLQDEADPHHFVTTFSGDDHHIADYLVEEVLQRQLVEVQRFLLQTSILDRLNVLLCNAITGRQDSRAMLNTLERTNLFTVPLDNRREWFRYHNLFSELLRRRLRQTYTSEDIDNLHRAAADWYESQGDIASAIHHARANSDHRAILRLLEQNAGSYFAAGELPQLFELASVLPAELRKESPFLCISVAWAALASNRNAEAHAWLESIEAHFGIPAEDILNDPTLDITRRAALLEVLVNRLQLPPTRSSDEQRTHILAIRDQLNSMPPEQICLLNTALNLKPVIAFNLGQHAENMGDLGLAVQSLTEAIPLCRQTQNSNLYCLAMAHLANVQITQGKLHLASQTFSQALAEAASFGEPVSPFIALSYAGLGALQFEWNNLDVANQYFNEGLLHARLWNFWEALLPLTLGKARLKQRVGDVKSVAGILNEIDSPPLPGQELPLQAYSALLGGSDSASAWLATNLTESNFKPDPTNEFLLLIVARLLVLAQHTEEAINLLQRIIDFAQMGERVHMLIQAEVALAVISNQPDVLLKTLTAAEPEGYVSTFVMEGEPVMNLLQHVLRQSNLEAHLQAYVRKILSAFNNVTRKSKQADGLIEALSERELEVLRYVANGLSNPEIARRLYLSPNTLKAHTQNIFLKLDVHNRVQAVNKAKELGLIE